MNKSYNRYIDSRWEVKTMNILKTLGLGAYYRMRRISKAMKNWKKFGVIIFGSIVLAAQVAGPVSAQAVNVSAHINLEGSTITLGQSETFTLTTKVNGVPQAATSIKWFVGYAQQTGFDNQTVFTVTPTAAGYYQIKAVATIQGVTVNDFATLVVNPAEGGNDDPGDDEPETGGQVNLLVHVSPEGSTIDLGQTEHFTLTTKVNGSMVSPDSVKWFVGSAQQVTFNNKTTLDVTPATSGTFTIKALVTEQGVTGQDLETLTVRPTNPATNQPPVAALMATPNSGQSPLSTVLNASGSFDSDGVIVKYEWDFDGNGSWDSTTTSSNILVITQLALIRG